MAEEGHTLQAEVLTPEGEVFSGQVRQLSTRTSVGELGVLANHAPVLARLMPTELRLHMPDGEIRRLAQAEGWLQVFARNQPVSHAVNAVRKLTQGSAVQGIDLAEEVGLTLAWSGGITIVFAALAIRKYRKVG